MSDTNEVVQVDYKEQIDKQKIEYDELMKADSEAGKLLQDTIKSVERQKGETEENEEEAEKKIKDYLAQHNEGKMGNEYLVRGAELQCTCGTNKRKLNLNICHGVYIKGHAVVHELDCIQGDEENITWFGACNQEGLDTEDIIVVGDDGKKHSGEKCKPHIVGVWMDTYEGTKIADNGDKMQDNAQNPVGCNTLTVGSFLVCKYGGIIAPINSGQGREVEESEFVEGKEAYERVMGFLCNEEVDVEEGCDDLMHAMITEEEIQKLPVHGSKYINTEALDEGENLYGTNYFTVVFQYEDGEIIEVQQVMEGKSAVAPTNLKTRVDYIFWGWDRDFDNIDQDIVIKATGVYKITDERNPQGIPLYSGKTMMCEAEFHTFGNHSEALYDNVKITFDSTRIEGSNYKYVHPQRYKECVDISGMGYNNQYHGTYCSNGNYFSLADNRMEIAVRKGISCVNGDTYDSALAGQYIDIVLADGTVLACILGASKGNEDGSSADGLIHHDGSIMELLVAGTRDETYPYGKKNANKYDILHGQDIVGFYTYPSLRLYDSVSQKYNYYFSEGEE